VLFNSIEFAFFLPLVYVLYWYVFQRNLKAQNFFILVASYTFYGWWDYRFLGLIFISSLVDYFLGLRIHGQNDERKRKLLLYASIGVNLGILGFFKYYNFFVDSFIGAFSDMGIHLQESTLNIVLPVGISFYTFQTLSYTIDIYRRQFEPTKDAIGFFAFVSFFPQLVAGPIERAGNLVPQFLTKRKFSVEKAKDGLRQILWGFFKKMVVADNVALAVNDIFDHHGELPAFTIGLGVIYFFIQVYCDFSAYSDIAIGTARLFGFNLVQNFGFPLFSRNIAEFWRRWHISLTTWFRDYVYIPLGGSKGGKWMKFRNVLIIFTVSGFWHGASVMSSVI
jgi:D-alanyl-lipoteichoic acid acyltransferase DltB (MBOAT superfamily)